MKLSKRVASKTNRVKIAVADGPQIEVKLVHIGKTHSKSFPCKNHGNMGMDVYQPRYGNILFPLIVWTGTSCVFYGEKHSLPVNATLSHQSVAVITRFLQQGGKWGVV